MEAALDRADHEGVARDAGAEVFAEPLREVVAATCPEGLAGPEPEERVGREPRAERGEAAVERVPFAERRRVEDVTVDERAAPLAVSPVLDLADGTARFVGEEAVEGFRPARDGEARVEASEAAVEDRACAPRRAQADEPSFVVASAVEEEDAERGGQRSRSSTAGGEGAGMAPATCTVANEVPYGQPGRFLARPCRVRAVTRVYVNPSALPIGWGVAPTVGS